MTTATLYEWRCGNCPPEAAPLLALVTAGGGVYIHGSAHRQRGAAVNVVADVRPAPLQAHCPRCHSWRRLVSDATGIHEEASPGPAIRIVCPCAEAAAE